MSIVDNPSAIRAFVQRCSNVTELISHRFGETTLLVDECLLPLGGRLEDVDQCDYVVALGKAHVFLPTIGTLLPSTLKGFQMRLSNYGSGIGTRL